MQRERFLQAFRQAARRTGVGLSEFPLDSLQGFLGQSIVWQVVGLGQLAVPVCGFLIGKFWVVSQPGIKAVSGLGDGGWCYLQKARRLCCRMKHEPCLHLNQPLWTSDCLIQPVVLCSFESILFPENIPIFGTGTYPFASTPWILTPEFCLPELLKIFKGSLEMVAELAGKSGMGPGN